MKNEEKIWISKAELETLSKDRLDFGFDSIYFRYAIAQDELAVLRARALGKDYEKERNKTETNKMHFWNCLEQIMKTHDNIEVKRK